jgi:hypothetical protein
MAWAVLICDVGFTRTSKANGATVPRFFYKKLTAFGTGVAN